MNEQLCSAINSRKIIRFYYNGGYRNVEPFCYGMGTSGNELLRGYQISGYSESGQPTDWKLFIVPDIKDLSITSESFSGTRPFYNPNDSAMTLIYCHV